MGRRPRLRRHRPARVAQAADRRGRGLRLAGGFEIALACDLIVAARDARFGIPEVKRGWWRPAAALLRLPRRIPYHVAMELALTGDPIGAERAAELGIVNRLAEPGGALDAALELAAAISKNAPLALDRQKEIAPAARATGPRRRSGPSRARSPARSSRSEDAQEGANAFAEKREPVWQGR